MVAFLKSLVDERVAYSIAKQIQDLAKIKKTEKQDEGDSMV